MPHGYTLDFERDDKIQFSKRHRNDEQTVVTADRDIPGEDWRVHVKDPRGNVDLGRFGTKAEARTKMKSWMGSHKKGVSGQSQGIAGANQGIPGMDGNGLFRQCH